MNPYPSSLLNDLHHYFPELLYRHERFQTVQDVLQYVVEIASVNRFEQEQRQYRSVPSSQEQKQEQKQEQEQEQEQEQQESGRNEYNFTASSSAYSAPLFTQPISSSASSASSEPSNQAEALLHALFQRRTSVSSRPPTNRFRMSVPINLSSFLSSEYSAPAPSVLQGLSQLNDLLRPVIIRPTEQHLAENTYVYRSEIALNDNCSICQDPMEAGQETRTILACSHCFHRDCIDRWFQEHVQCPTCRHDVRDS